MRNRLCVLFAILTACGPSQAVAPGTAPISPLSEPILVIDQPATAFETAKPIVVRTTTSTEPAAPTTLAPIAGRCVEYEQLLVDLAPPSGWDVIRMSRFMYRESHCTAAIRSKTSDSGLLQINDINHEYLRTALGEWVDRYTLFDPVQNIRAAAALCTYWVRAGGSCYQPWATS